MAAVYAAVSRSRSAGATPSGKVRTGAKNRLSSGRSTTIASSCTSTFSITGRGCTTPRAAPSRMLTMAWSIHTTMPPRRFSQLS